MELVLSLGGRDPDREVIDRILAGDQGAFEALVTRYHRPIYSLAYRMVRNTEEAADLTQEIFIRVWEKLGSFRGEARFSTWFFQLAGNHCRNRLKAMKRRRYLQHEPLEGLSYGDEDRPARQLASEDRGPRELLEEADVGALVRKTLEELPEEQRIVVTMRDIDELDYDEISQATGLPLGTVKSRIHRGRIELARRLKKELARKAV